VKLDDVLAYPHQIEDALWRIESAGIPRREAPGGLAVCGPGQGAGGLAAAILGDRATAPVRDGLEPGTGDDTFALCASYSGDDEDALACFAEAGRRDCPRAVVCTAGALAAAAREEGVPVIGIPAGLEPSTAVVYFTLAALECAALAGAAPSLRAGLERAPAALEGVTEEEAKAVAEEFRAGTPVLVGEPAVVRRWAELVEPLAGPPRDPLRRLDLDGLAHGETRTERILSLVMLGDLVALRLVT
jgi:glucose/mannose-6-phosphate isomerase